MKISNIYIPSDGNPDQKIWVIGECPGEQEVKQRLPFVGPSGQLLEEVLLANGLDRTDVFLTNLCHYKPAWNNFNLLHGSTELQEGLDEIWDLCDKHRPNIVILAGYHPLQYLTGCKGGIGLWRGSTIRLIPNLSGKPIKAMPIHHPAYILRNPMWHSVLLHDIGRAVEESEYPELRLPKYDIKIDPVDIEFEGRILSCDIESVRGTSEIICIGFSSSSRNAFVFTDHRRGIVQHLLANNLIVFQNGFFDVAILNDNGITDINWYADTFLQAKALDPEFPRGLDFLASMHTRQPYYKGSGRESLAGDVKSWGVKKERGDIYVYNAKDCAVTKQVYEKQAAYLLRDDEARRVYEFEMELAPALVWMSRNGCLIDEDRREAIRLAVDKERVKKYMWLWALVKAATGEEHKFTAGQNKVIGIIFYDILKMPEKKKRDIKSKVNKRTTDDSALVALIADCQKKIDSYKTQKKIDEWKLNLGIVQLVRELRGLEKLMSSYIDFQVSEDGRVRGSYRSSTETGRLSCSLYVDGSGLNQQTWPRKGVEIGSPNT